MNKKHKDASISILHEAEKPILHGNQTVDFSEIIQLANNHEVDLAINKLNEILDNSQNIHPELLSTAYLHRSILYLSETTHCRWEKALDDLYQTTQIATKTEEKIPNDNFNIQGSHFSSEKFLQANQAAQQIISWMRKKL